MSKRTFKAAVLLLLAAAGLLALFGFSPESEKQIEGSWAATVASVNPPIPPFSDLITFIPAGEVVESRRYYVTGTPFGSLLETSGHGVWQKAGPREYRAKFVFLLQSAPDTPTAQGAPVGTDNITLDVQLNQEGTQLDGTFRSDIKDTGGNVLFTATGNYSASRIAFAP